MKSIFYRQGCLFIFVLVIFNYAGGITCCAVAGLPEIQCPTAQQEEKGIAQVDMRYRSPRGYSILVPGSYSYTVCDAVHPDMSLLFIKYNNDEPAASFTMTTLNKNVINTDQSLERIADEICKGIVQFNKNSRFTNHLYSRVAGEEAFTIDSETLSDETPLQGKLLFMKKNDRVYNLYYVARRDQYRKYLNDYERVVQSLRLE
ncbi:MAG: hypothetical protein KKH94_08270 [Candidatus Omnitrophica bacterium]|nr:hypothetical protein [Candidatus Omnitrophota bacterium]